MACENSILVEQITSTFCRWTTCRNNVYPNCFYWYYFAIYIKYGSILTNRDSMQYLNKARKKQILNIIFNGDQSDKVM